MTDKRVGTYLSFCNARYEKKDDDWETPIHILQDLCKFINKDDIIYDPFYCDGYVAKQWDKLGYTCLNQDEDAFNKDTHPFCFDIIITNIPFSLKQKIFHYFLTLYPNKPMMFLIPAECMCSKWIQPYWDKLQFIIPNGRYSFFKKSQKKVSSFWKNTCWYCFNCNLSEKIVRI